MNMNITKVNFPGNQYVQTPTAKDIFVIHHSAGWDNASDMYHHWANDSQGRVATAYGIVNDGTIYQGFDTRYWAYALYVNHAKNLVDLKYKTSKNDERLNSRAIQVEICNWGALENVKGKFYAWPAKETNNYSAKYEVPKEKVIYYHTPFRGSHWYERYTDQEIASLRQLILHHHQQDGLDLTYNPDMWDVSNRALEGTPGIWAHVSYRTNKSDAHPQPELIKMLQELRP